jgi:secreted trypsin-like serine protease
MEIGNIRYCLNILSLLIFVSLVSMGASEGQFRVKAGQKAKLGQFPFVVYLEATWNRCNRRGCNDITTMCGGVIVDERLFLTAAHCICHLPLRIDVYTTVLNNYKFNLPDGKYKVVDRIYKQEFSEFCGHNDGMGEFDVAIAQVDRPFQLSDNVKIAQLSTNLAVDQHVTIVGYGLDATVTNGQERGILKYGRAKVSTTCPDTYTRLAEAICINNDENVQSIDLGDSGSPMIDDNQDVIAICSGYHRQSPYAPLYSFFATVKRNEWFIQKAVQAFCGKIDIKQAT